MSSLFGTDGVRARINTGPMTAENITRLALAAGKFFLDRRDDAKSAKRQPLVVIGKDTRLSGYMVEAALQAGFASIGMSSRLLGPLPTPGVAYLTRTLRADLGVMISASHNPHEDNGIKFFGPDGFKLPDEDEDAIAAIMKGHISLAAPTALGRARRMLDGVGRYVESVKTAVPAACVLTGSRLLSIAPMVLLIARPPMCCLNWARKSSRWPLNLTARISITNVEPCIRKPWLMWWRMVLISVLPLMVMLIG